MHVGVHLEFKGDRKEPLGDMLRRVIVAFERAGIQPTVTATFADAPGGIRSVSAVDRALKKNASLSRLQQEHPGMPQAGLPPTSCLTNVGSAESFPVELLLLLADGVPRSLPFHAISINLTHNAFGVLEQTSPFAPKTGVTIGDSWWVNGRTRVMHTLYVVEGEAAARKLPDPPTNVASILRDFGKPKRKGQLVPTLPVATPRERMNAGAHRVAARDIAMRYRATMRDVVERAKLPFALPPASEARTTSLGASGALKPALVDAFQSRGFDCRGESGTFTLRRRTAANHVVSLELDVGTWSRSLSASLRVIGPDGHASVLIPADGRDAHGQYPIGDTENWTRIVANLTAVVDELERSFVMEIESAWGAAPEWFSP